MERVSMEALTCKCWRIKQPLLKQGPMTDVRRCLNGSHLFLLLFFFVKMITSIWNMPCSIRASVGL